MSAPNPAEAIAEALGRHYAVLFGVCMCGWQTTRTKVGESWRPEFDEHQASVIAALPDIAIVPVIGGLNGFMVDSENFIVDSDSYDTVCHLDVAEKFAGRLLAVARAARAAGGAS